MDWHVALGLLIPVAFLGFTGAVKSLIRDLWIWSNFYFGVDMALAAMASAVVNIVDLAHGSERAQNPDLAHQAIFTAICIVTAFAALLVTMGLHQKFENPGAVEPDNRQLMRGILLGIIGNSVGASALGLFIYWKLKVLV